MTAENRSAQELAADRTEMASTRTLMAADRTLMAWIRTAFSMLSFGFTIYKLLEGLAQSGRVLPSEHTPRNLGLFLALMGTLAMVMGTIEYVQTLKQLRQFGAVSFARSSLIMAIVIAAFGLFLFFGIIAGLL